MLVFDAPVSTPANITSTSLFDEMLQSSVPTSKTSNTSPTKNFFSDSPFTQTTTSSNDANWGAFVETTKQPTSILTNTPLTNTMSMPTNTFAHPPPEPADKYAALSELFSSQNTMHDHQPSIFGNTANGGHQTSASGLNNSIFGNAPFSSPPQVPPTTTGITPKFPVQQQTNIFSSQPFPSQFPPASNPFVQQQQQQPFGANASNFFGMPPTHQPNPFLNIAQQQQPSAQQLPNQFGKPRANSTNPFL
jgi:hypothetical protein